jgi:type VI secretion system Hcp family effector
MKRSRSFPAIVATVALACAATAIVAEPARAQHELTARIRIDGHNGTTSAAVLSWRQEIVSPRDAATGLATERRPYMPLSVVMAPGQASQTLRHALETDEHVRAVTVQLTRPIRRAPSGRPQEEIHYRLRLTNASVVSITSLYDAAGGAREEIALAFEKIDIDGLLLTRP